MSSRFIGRICKGCDYVEAEAIVCSIAPDLTCHAPTKFDPNYFENCSSEPNKVVVADFDSRNTWGFTVSHSNQGAMRHQMSLSLLSVFLSGALDNNHKNLPKLLEKYHTIVKA